MRELADQGGRVIWSAVPPLLDLEGRNCRADWEDLFAVDWTPQPNLGWIVPGKQVEFEGDLEGIPPQPILTHFLVDRVYTVRPRNGAAVVARVMNKAVGVTHRTAAGGSLTYLGFRPRDDQSRSLGYDARWWFDILDRLGAYPATGAFNGINDNTETLSRTGPFLCCRFPNGAVSVAPHLRTYEENWPGGFGRKRDRDAEVMREHPPPSPEIRLDGFHVNGHTVTYFGHGPVTFRVDDAGSLVGFAGHQCREITVDNRTWVMADRRLNTLVWAPLPAECRVEHGAVMLLQMHAPGNCELRIPDVGLPPKVAVFAQGRKPGSRGPRLDSERRDGALVIRTPPAGTRGIVFVVPE